jgi:hypothetical protein
LGEVWSIGVFAEKAEFDFRQHQLTNLVKLFSGRTLRTTREHVHTYADPFLFSDRGSLYLFAEKQEIDGRGYINAWRTDDLVEWQDLGPVLKGQHHYSYPQIIRTSNQDIHLLPESLESREVAIYRFANFPTVLQKEHTLLTGPYADSSIVYWQGVYYLSTFNCQTRCLELFYADDLYQSNWQRHPGVCIIPQPFARNGGGFTLVGSRLFRIAQNNERRDGGGIAILEVVRLDKSNYREEISVRDYGPKPNYQWQKQGRHHLSITRFRHKAVAAMDGVELDYLLNKPINLMFMLTGAFCSTVHLG